MFHFISFLRQVNCQMLHELCVRLQFHCHFHFELCLIHQLVSISGTDSNLIFMNAHLQCRLFSLLNIPILNTQDSHSSSLAETFLVFISFSFSNVFFIFLFSHFLHFFAFLQSIACFPQFFFLLNFSFQFNISLFPVSKRI